MKKLLPPFIALSLISFSVISQAQNLLQVYQHARESNPDLRQSAAERNEAFEKINEYRGVLLPQLGLAAGYSRVDGYRDNDGINSNATEATLNLKQTLFDMAKWGALTLQEKQAGIQDIAFRAKEQSLILDTATAYFQVLRTIDALSYIEAHKQNVYRQLDHTTQRFNVGLVAITDVHNARSQYDTVLANEVSARNDLDNALESLSQLTGVFYPELAALNVDRFSMQPPEMVNHLLNEAENHNLKLLSARLSQDLAREKIKTAQANHVPTLDITASTGISNNRSSLRSGNNAGDHKLGVSFNLPLYSGGVTYSRVKQAQHNFIRASEQLESAHRQMVHTVRSSFNNISASISSVAAYKQAVVSAQSSLEAMEVGYQVGTRTILDVLKATSELYNAKKQLSNARYDYLINQLKIKSAVGTLNSNDLHVLNDTLDKWVATSANRMVLGS